MSVSILAAVAPKAALSTQGLVSHLQSLFGPLFRGIVDITELFFLFTREITQLVQFIEPRGRDRRGLLYAQHRSDDRHGAANTLRRHHPHPHLDLAIRATPPDASPIYAYERLDR